MQPDTKQPILRLDDAGRLAAARAIAGRSKEGFYSGNQGVAEMYQCLEHAGIRVKNVDIDRTGGASVAR